MVVAREFDIVGREIERARLAQFVDNLAEGVSATLIHGEAGIGKTVLWRSAVERADQAGAIVASTRCVPAEMPVAFGGLADLVGGSVADAAEELPVVQRQALAVAVGLEPPDGPIAEPIVVARALVAVLERAAQSAPVLVAIDDAQWLDVSSKALLSFAVRRLGEASVGLLVAERGTGDALGLRRAFEDLAEIEVGPLSLGALHHLLRTQLGLRIPRPRLARVHEASGGNPMFALQFAQATAAAGAPLPVPASLEDLVRDRVNGLPRRLLPFLAAVAALERPTPSRLDAAVDDAPALLDAASVAGAVTLDEDGVVRFTHPLLASAAYAAVPPGTRRALHARLAAGGADPEEQARHLALATARPEASIALRLEEAAVRARARGAPHAAAELAEHALRLTPSADAEGRKERALAVATYLAYAGDMAKAHTVVTKLLAGPLAGPRRAKALLLAYLVSSNIEDARLLAEEALEHAGEDRALHVRALLTLASYPIEQGDFAAAERMAREALAVAQDLDDPVLLSAALTAVGGLSAASGRPEHELLERAVALAGDNPPLQGFFTPRYGLAQVHLSTGHVRAARELLEAELESTRIWADENTTQRVLHTLIHANWWAGEWDSAERRLRELSALVFDGDYQWGEAFVRWQQGLLAASRGRVDDARRLAREAIANGEGLDLPWFVVRGRWLLGFLALSLDKPVDAWEALPPLAEMAERLARPEPQYAQILPEGIEAAIALGLLDEAEPALATLDTYANGYACRWATPTALRCTALLRLAHGDADAALDAAEQAAADFEAAGFPLDRGRALLVAGEALRRLGERRRAAEKLGTAKAVFDALGAPLWAARAERELRRASPRPTHDGQLTGAERRVASLVAAGRTNREVAAQVFTTVGTVEVHLTRIYRKLDLRSRSELAGLVAAGTLDLTDE